jgi:hypothetical protein
MDVLTSLEFAIVVASWGIASVVFRGYEAHVPWSKRVWKLLVVLVLLTTVHLVAGRVWFYACLGALSAGIAVLHGYWFHHKHGIHWRTAEPRAAYLRLIGRGRSRPEA